MSDSKTSSPSALQPRGMNILAEARCMSDSSGTSRKLVRLRVAPASLKLPEVDRNIYDRQAIDGRENGAGSEWRRGDAMKAFGFAADMRGVIPETWACIDCGINTAPGFLSRARAEEAFAADWNHQGVKQTVNEWSEIYSVKPGVWKAAGMQPMGGCLCTGCLERRLGRTFVPKDFLRNHPFHWLPGTAQLMERRDGRTPPPRAPEVIRDRQAVKAAISARGAGAVAI
jgi:hypothetical protein